MEDILVHGQSVIYWALTALGLALAKYCWSRVSNDWVRAFLGRVYDEVNDAVREVYQTYVDAIRAKSADGTLTDAEKAEAKAMAVATAKANLGTKGLRRCMKMLGLKPEQLDSWLGTKVEAAVRTSKLGF